MSAFIPLVQWCAVEHPHALHRWVAKSGLYADCPGSTAAEGHATIRVEPEWHLSGQATALVLHVLSGELHYEGQHGYLTVRKGETLSLPTALSWSDT